MTRAGKLAALSTLYFVQGLPTGFVADALKPYLTKLGVPLAALGLLTFLGAPWSLKPLFAPLVDRFQGGPLGPRKSFIVPLQAGMIVTAVAATFVPLPGRLDVLVALVLAMNTCAAMMDIAVDGLAVDVLDEGELGHANSAQVVGFKGGMFAAGVALAWVAAKNEWGLWFVFAGMAALVTLALVVTLAWKEPARKPPAETRVTSESVTLLGVLRVLLRAATSRNGLALLAFVATYKLGETLIDAMYQPFLVRSGHPLTTVHAWLGWGLIASMLGSLAGGTLASAIPLRRALFAACFLRAVPLFGEWWLAAALPGDWAFIGVTVAEHFFGGALTVVVFAVMMHGVNKDVGASHYTALAGVEVLGKFLPGLASGVLAERMGFANLFAMGALVQLACLALLFPMRRAIAAEPEAR